MCGFLVQFSQKNDDFNHFEEANDLFNRIGNENFYGIGRALVRELALSQI